MIDYAAILSRKYFGKEWTLNGDLYEGLIWNEKTAKPTQKTLDDLWPQVQTEILAEIEAKKSARQDVLNRLGITADEAALLLS
jgi:hypothetical protein